MDNLYRLLYLVTLICLKGCVIGNSSTAKDAIGYSYKVGEVQTVTLPNGLDVVMLTDPLIEHAEVALTVGIGYKDDPVGYSDLAHLIEHLIFRGSASESLEDFRRLVQIFGGEYRAVTKDSYTSYSFFVPHNELFESIDKFSKLFVERSFESSDVIAEMNIISEEDFYRHYILGEKTRLINAHIQNLDNTKSMGEYKIGEGLWTLPSRKVLQHVNAMYNTYYHAENMTLAIVSPYSKEKILHNLPIRFSRIYDYPESFDQTLEESSFYDKGGKKVYVNNPGGENSIRLAYRIDSNNKKKTLASLKHISNLISVPYDGGFFEVYGNNNWSKNINISFDTMYFDSAIMLYLDVTPTNAGWENREEIVYIIDRYFKFLREGNYDPKLVKILKKWESMSLGKSKFKAIELSLDYSPIHLMSKYDSGREFYNFEEKHYNAVLDRLILENANIIYSGDLGSGQESMKEEQIQFNIVNQENVFRSRGKRASDGFKLPTVADIETLVSHLSRKRYVGDNEEAPVSSDDGSYKLLSLHGYDVYLWSIQKNNIATTKSKGGVLELTWIFSVGGASAEEYVVADILSKISYYSIKDKISESGGKLTRESFRDKEIHISISPSGKSSLRISGIHSLNDIVVKALMDSIINIELSNEYYDAARRRVKEQYLSEVNEERPLGTIANNIFRTHALASGFSAFERQKALDAITLDLVREHHEKMISLSPIVGYTNMFILDNETDRSQKEDFEEADLIPDIYSSPFGMHDVKESIYFGCVNYPVSIYKNVLFSTENSPHVIASLKVLEPFLEAYFFSTFRRNRDYSYFVESSVEFEHGVTSLQFSIMSRSATSNVLYNDVELFKKGLLAYLNGIPEEQYDRVIARLVVSSREGGTTGPFYSELHNHGQGEALAESLRRLDKQSAINIFSSYTGLGRVDSSLKQNGTIAKQAFVHVVPKTKFPQFIATIPGYAREASREFPCTN